MKVDSIGIQSRVDRTNFIAPVIQYSPIEVQIDRQQTTSGAHIDTLARSSNQKPPAYPPQNPISLTHAENPYTPLSNLPIISPTHIQKERERETRNQKSHSSHKNYNYSDSPTPARRITPNSHSHPSLAPSVVAPAAPPSGRKHAQALSPEPHTASRLYRNRPQSANPSSPGSRIGLRYHHSPQRTEGSKTVDRERREKYP